MEGLAFVFDMNVLFEEFVAEFLRRHKDRVELDGGRRLARVARQRVLGKLFGEFNMEVDLVLEDNHGCRFLVDTKYKTLHPWKDHRGLSQADFYQMYAYSRAGNNEYDVIFLLYPATQLSVEEKFQQDETTLFVRQFDPRKVYDPATERLNARAMKRELGRARGGAGADGLLQRFSSGLTRCAESGATSTATRTPPPRTAPTPSTGHWTS